MGMIVHEIGDKVYYPYFGRKSDRETEVIDRELIVYRGSKKIFFRYLLSDLLKYLAEDMHRNVNNDLDNIVVVSGPEGSGKSHLAFQLCKLYDPNFDMEKNYIYDYDEFLDTITDENFDDRDQVFWLDESTNIASNRDSLATDNKRFIQLLEMMRSRHWSLVMCIPSLERLDRYLRDFRIRYNIVACEKSWDVRYEKKRGYFELRFKKGASAETFHTVGYGEFPPMTPEERAVYEKIKRRSQERKMQEIRNESERRKSEGDGGSKGVSARSNQNLCLYMHEELGYEYDRIAEITGMSRNSVRDACSYARTRKRKEGTYEG